MMLQHASVNYGIRGSALARDLRGRKGPKGKGAPVFKWDEDRRREKRARLARLLKGARAT